jgi:DmsE family decaheme c-type cytochrome
MGVQLDHSRRAAAAHLGAAILSLALVAGVSHSANAADKMTAEDCGICHEDTAAAMAHNPHGVMDRADSGITSPTGASCTACHGDPTKHLEPQDGGGPIFSFGESASAREKTERCMSCHADSHPRFFKTAHARAGVDCTSCHAIHDAPAGSVSLLRRDATEAAFSPAMGQASLNCVRCHSDVRTQFDYSQHHRLREGIMECTSCHNPHEPQSRVMLGGFKQAQCTKCHTDKAGPFVFEHGSVRGEGCVACHQPHGSPNRHQLTFQNVANLCFSCHAEVPSFHTRFTAETRCTNCHSSIHGSNFDPAFLK